MTADAPRTWMLPDEPGPEVTAVRTTRGQTWRRIADQQWCHVTDALAHRHEPWSELVYNHGPLTDATPAAPDADAIATFDQLAQIKRREDI